MSKPKTEWAVWLICLLAFVVIGLLADRIFEHVPHSEDEVAYLFQAKVFAQNRLTVPTPANPDAFWSPFVVDYQGVRFGKYPPGWPLLLSLGVRWGQPWLVNALLGVATLALIARLGRLVYSPVIGLWAAGLGLITPGFLFLSASLLSHAASLFWTSLALLALYQLTEVRLPRRRDALLLGIALGCIFLTRPFAALGLGLAVAGYLGAGLLRREGAWPVLPWLVASGLLTTALLPLYRWGLSGDPTFNPYLLVWPYDKVGFGPDVGPLGYSLADAIFINTRLKLTALGTGLFGWPGWSNLLFMPLIFISRRANRWDWLLLGSLAGMIFVHLFYWAFGGIDGGFPRYYYDALPALLLLTARGIVILSEGLRRWRPRLAYAPAALVVGLTLYAVVFRWPGLVQEQQGKYGITPASVRLVAQAKLPEPALVLVQGVETWSDFAAPFVANSPGLEGPVVYAIDWGPETRRRVRAQFPGRSCWLLAEAELLACP